MTRTTTNQTFDGLAFPVARVRYTGNSSRWAASMYRDRDRSYRATVAYDHAVGGGARGALPAALKVLSKALADLGVTETAADYVAVPGDFSADAYAFTFVPAHFFNGHER